MFRDVCQFGKFQLYFAGRFTQWFFNKLHISGFWKNYNSSVRYHTYLLRCIFVYYLTFPNANNRAQSQWNTVLADQEGPDGSIWGWKTLKFLCGQVQTEYCSSKNRRIWVWNMTEISQKSRCIWEALFWYLANMTCLLTCKAYAFFSDDDLRSIKQAASRN